MKAIAIGWQGALLGNLLVVALFFYRNSPPAWAIIATLTALQAVITVWVLWRQRNPALPSSSDAQELTDNDALSPELFPTP